MAQSLINKINNSLTKVSLKDMLFFTNNLSLMIKSGVSVSQAIEALQKQTENAKLQAVLKDVSTRIKKGEKLSSALAKHPKVFSDIFINMIKSGEESGKLEEVLNTLSNQLHKDHDLISKIKGALAYPIVVLCATLSITSALIIFVIPKIKDLFLENELSLPLPTRILLGFSNFLINYFYLFLIFLVVAVIFFIKFKKSLLGKQILHRIILSLPILSKLSVKINLARISRSLSSLLRTDIPVLKSFLVTSKVVKNVYYKKSLEQAAEKIKHGSSIHEALKAQGDLFPATMLQIVSVGEDTGSLDEILDEMAKFYEEDLDNTLNNLPSLIEPFLVLFLGVVVGGIALSIMMPIFNLTKGALK